MFRAPTVGVFLGVLLFVICMLVGIFGFSAIEGWSLQDALEEISICKGSPLVGRSLEEAAIRQQTGVIIIAIKKTNGDMVFNPEASVDLDKDDILIAIGKDSGLRQLGITCREPAGA